MNMNAFNTLRLLKLLSGGVSPQDEPVHSPGYGDPSTELPNPSGFGDPNLDNLPNPRFSGGPDGNDLTPGEKNIPFGGPKPPNPDEQRIRDLYSKEPAGMAAYRAYLANAPTHDKYEASTGRKIFAALAGIGTELSNHALARRGVSGGSSGMDVTNSIIDEPYNDALKDWTIKGKGLGAVAALDEKQQNNAVKGEETIQNMRDRRTQQDAINAQREATLQEKISENQRRADNDKLTHEDRVSALDANKEYRQELVRLRGETNDIRREAEQNKSEPGVWTTDATGRQVYTPRSQAFGKTKLTQADETIVSSAKQIQSAITNLKKKLTPEIVAKIGKVHGTWGEITQKLGVSGDKDLMDVSREMSTLELQHPKIFGLRASNATMDKVTKLFGNISQQPEGFNSALDVMYGNAGTTIKSRIPDYVDPNENKDEFTITEKK